MLEDCIYQSGAVKITQTLVRIGGTSYPVNGIGSVRIEPSNAGVIAVLALASAGAGLAYPDFRLVAFIFAAIFGLRLLNARAKLIIHTASGDQTALTAWQEKALRPIMEAIERAVSLRG